MKDKAKRSGKKETSFEEALENLEQIVKRLESGDLSLEDALTLFEEGVALTRVCSQRLEAAEKKIEILMRDEAGGVKARAADPAAYEQGAEDAEGEGPSG
jgi:exodeoxyribonuclease VII small subunit